MEKDFLDHIQNARRLCLNNASELIKAAQQLKGKNHIRYHLATLALEEIGKSAMAESVLFRGADKNREGDTDLKFDDHVKKLFWAFIGGVLRGKVRISKDEIESLRKLAKSIHTRRLEGLYVDLSSSAAPGSTISKKVADDLVKLAYARLMTEKSYSYTAPSKSHLEDLEWFFHATNDPDKRPLIYGNSSLIKLEELKDGKEWISWLRAQFTSSEAESRAAITKELQRKEPKGKARLKDKWRIKFRLYSASHSLKPAVFDRLWNGNIEGSTLIVTGKKVYDRSRRDELLCELILPAAVPVQAVWDAARNWATALAVALSSGSWGVFWWRLPQDVATFADEIFDIEQDMQVKLEQNPNVKIAFPNQSLSEESLDKAMTIFLYFMRDSQHFLSEMMKHYALGLSFFSKTDINLRLERNAFDEFYEALRSAMIETEDLAENDDFTQKAIALIGPSLKDTRELERALALALENQTKTESTRTITLTDVFAMKMYLDIYLYKKSREFLEALHDEETGNPPVGSKPSHKGSPSN